MGNSYISNVYNFHDCSYHVYEKGTIAEWNHRTKKKLEFQLSQKDILRLQTIALKYKYGDVLLAETVRDIFYNYVIQGLSPAPKIKPR